MKKEIFVSVSTDPISDYQSLLDYVKEIQDKADFLHCDVMDGLFVERKTISAQLVNNINANSAIMLDVHLMCKEPFKLIKDFVKAGANFITIHHEAFSDKEKLNKCIDEIHDEGCLAGLAINPSTQIKDIKVFLHKLDLILVMSVFPGKSGQKFMPEVLTKIKELNQIRRENDFKYKIEIDGGINLETGALAIEAGVDILVSGSFIYQSKDRLETIKSLKNL